MKQSQRERIEEKLIQDGYVDVPWLIQGYITRGAAIIHMMRKDGWVIRTDKVEGAIWATYTLISLPDAEQGRLL